ncbi:MAG: hypothetical protein HPY53_05250 [Brevinematales bacterium]|nr:hypothetical protein [Brevinematales bacterium]
MTIDFTEQQYKTLSRALFLASIMVGEVNELDPEADVDNEEYQSLLSMVGSRAQDFKSSGDFTPGEKGKGYIPTHALEEECSSIIESYDEIVFWDELIHRLSSRDMHAEYGDETLHAMEVEEIIEKESPFIDKYAEEFEKNGIDRMVVK